MLKPEYHALYIQNPIERELNVSKNVSLEETERLRIEVRNAVWALEEGFVDRNNQNESWGLLHLFASHKILKGSRYPGRRLFEISGLFEGDDNVIEGALHKHSVQQRGLKNVNRRNSSKETSVVKQRRR